MKFYRFVIGSFSLALAYSCNNSANTIEKKDSTNIQSVPDNTQNADTSKPIDTASFERMPQKMNDSPHVH